MSNTRHFTVRGEISCLFIPPSGTYFESLANIEVQLWQKSPLHEIFLEKGMTDSSGEFVIDFQMESPIALIDDGKIKDVFIKAYYNDELLNPPEYDPDAQLYFTQLSPQPSVAFKAAVNTLVLQLKASGDWPKFDRLWIHATEYQQHARISLVNPTVTPITEVSSPSWSSSLGYTGNASTSYLDTNFNPATSASQFLANDGCFFYYSRTNLQQASIDMGCGEVTTGNKGSWLAPKWSDTNTYARLQSSTSTTGTNITNTSGLLYVKRAASGTTTYGQNGSQVGSISQTQTGIASANFFICGGSLGTALSAPSSRQIALSGVGSSGVNQNTLYSIIQAFATTLGFNV